MHTRAQSKHVQPTTAHSFTGVSNQGTRDGAKKVQKTSGMWGGYWERNRGTRMDESTTIKPSYAPWGIICFKCFLH